MAENVNEKILCSSCEPAGFQSGGMMPILQTFAAKASGRQTVAGKSQRTRSYLFLLCFVAALKQKQGAGVENEVKLSDV